MIGVLVSPKETAAAAEFFQLFKTPWEPYVAGQRYDVVITTVPIVPTTDARLVVICGPEPSSFDPVLESRPGRRQRSGTVQIGQDQLPIYGEILTFEKTDATPACTVADGSVAGFWKRTEKQNVLRLGYNLFEETRHLLTYGQPIDHARIPTLDLHIDALRRWILEAQISFVEIPPNPAITNFIVCLTHDIDFVGIRRHRFDHTMWGFLFRATVGALQGFLRGRIGFGKMLRCWSAALTLPLVYLGLRKDFWLPFDWYLKVEEGLPATYYLIPFKHRTGERVPSRYPNRRATAYDVSDLTDDIRRLKKAGCEIGVHGIDSWHDSVKGREEYDRVASACGQTRMGIRMHWLLNDTNTFRTLERAGYDYDATVGYNETPGYRAGTNQVYRPFGTKQTLELPLQIQDGALFYSQRLHLAESEAMEMCTEFVVRTKASGGVLTLSWHDRSHGPERFWGDFYVRLLDEVRSCNAWFATAGQAVDWFRARRSISFESSSDHKSVIAHCQGGKPESSFRLRIHRPPSGTIISTSSAPTEVEWSGESPFDISALIGSQPDQLRSGQPAEHQLASRS